MKAVRKLEAGPGHIALCEVPEPVVEAADAVKISVRACGLCGTDLHIRDGGYGFRPPVTMGHEISGDVAAVGSAVTRVRAGDRVTVNPTASGCCGTCRDCRRGAYFFCSERKSYGSILDGGFAASVVVPEQLVFAVPADVSYAAAALVEPFACCVKAVRLLTKVSNRNTVLVCGPGPIGLMCGWLAKDAGARVVLAGTASDAGRLASAREMGLGDVVDVSRVDVVGWVKEKTGGAGADVAIDCGGTAGSVAQCLEAVRNGGQVTQVALVDAPIEVDWGRVIYKELTVRGAIATDWASWDLALEMVTSGRIDLGMFVTHRHPLEVWERAFENADRKIGLKQVITPN